MTIGGIVQGGAADVDGRLQVSVTAPLYDYLHVYKGFEQYIQCMYTCNCYVHL